MNKYMTEFDKSEILTCVTADKAKVGDIGFFGNSVWDLRATMESFPPTEIVGIADETKPFRFIECSRGLDHPTEWSLFHPASYKCRQAQWLEKNKLKVGSYVQVSENAKMWENIFYFGGDRIEIEAGAVCRIKNFNSDYIEITREAHTFYACYSALELPFADEYLTQFGIALKSAVKDVGNALKLEYRPFCSAQEFKPHHHRLLRRKGEEERYDVVCAFDHEGVSINNEWWIYPCLFDDYVFDDTGEPVGVKL